MTPAATNGTQHPRTQPNEVPINMKARLRYLVEDTDRHGNLRFYVRIPGSPKIRIRATPDTPEFFSAYQAAIAGNVERPRQRTNTPTVGSFGRLCLDYYASSTFKLLDPSTQSWRRRYLDAICEKEGDKRFALMEGRHIRRLRDERADKPGAANVRLKALKALFAWATEEELAEHNPTQGVKKLHYATHEHHTWTVEEIEQFKRRHPLGTKPRLAMDILRFTTGRREDAVRLGHQHLRNGRIQFRQAKNEHRHPIDIDIPAHQALIASIEATPSGNLTFLVTQFGRPFTPAGFGQRFRDWCDQADLHHCSAHGLRKATPTQMAENGATPHELMAITGHQTLEEVERYTRQARRRGLADSAMAKLKG